MPITSSPFKGTQPNCFDRIKIGFAMGFCVGLASGFLFGGIGSLRAGLRGAQLLSETGKIMIKGGGTFGTFMAVGSAIRC